MPRQLACACLLSSLIASPHHLQAPGRQLLIATSAAEEGLDVPSCEFVVRASPCCGLRQFAASSPLHLHALFFISPSFYHACTGALLAAPLRDAACAEPRARAHGQRLFPLPSWGESRRGLEGRGGERIVGP